MLHLSRTATRAACATLLLLPAMACAPAIDPAKACASPATVEGLKAVLFNAAAQNVGGLVGRGLASLPNVRLALELPRLASFDRTTKKATCEGRLTTTSAVASGGAPQHISEDVSYTVQPSAREGEIIYAVAAAPSTIALLQRALPTKAARAASAPPNTADAANGSEPLHLDHVRANVGTAANPIFVEDDVFDISAHPAAYRKYLSIIPPSLRGEDWVRKFNGSGATFTQVSVGGQPMLFGTMSRPHVNGADTIAVLLTLDQRHAYGSWTKDANDENTPSALLGDTPEGLRECLHSLTAAGDDDAKPCDAVRF